MDSGIATAVSAVKWKTIIGVGLSVKFVFAGAAYMVWAVSATTGAHRREEFMEHAQAVFSNLRASGEGLTPEDAELLEKKFAILQSAVPVGFRSGEEMLAFKDVLEFLTLAHAKSTSDALKDILGRMYAASLDWGAADTDPPHDKGGSAS